MSFRGGLHDSDVHRGSLIAPHDHPARKSLVSFVVPVYNESAVVGAFYERATQTLAALEVKPRPMYIVDQLIESDPDSNSGQA